MCAGRTDSHMQERLRERPHYWHAHLLLTTLAASDEMQINRSRPSMDTLHACIIEQYIYNIIQYNTYTILYHIYNIRIYNIIPYNIYIKHHTMQYIHNVIYTIQYNHNKNTKLWFNEECYKNYDHYNIQLTCTCTHTF